MPLRTINTVPPGGWRYEQTLPSGEVKKWHSMNLAWDLAETIADFRKGNGLERATAKEALHDIEEATCTRLHNDPAHCIPADKKKGVRAALDRASRSARAAATGGKVLVDWLGSRARPVVIDIAQRRADVCLECEHNKEGHSFLRLTAETVKAIAEQMQAREALKLRVEGEERLKACDVCACPLPLKVHVPLNNILQHTDEATLNAFPPWCWVTTERKNL